jgi:hypothetical protein
MKNNWKEITLGEVAIVNYGQPSVGDDIYDNIIGQRYAYGHGTSEMATDNSLNELFNLNGMVTNSEIKNVAKTEKKSGADTNKTTFSISGNQNQQGQVNQNASDNEDITASSKENLKYLMLIIGGLIAAICKFKISYSRGEIFFSAQLSSSCRTRPETKPNRNFTPALFLLLNKAQVGLL